MTDGNTTHNGSLIQILNGNANTRSTSETYTIVMTDTTFDDNTDTMDWFLNDNSLIKIVEDGSSCTQLPLVWANVTDNDVITDAQFIAQNVNFSTNNSSEANIFAYCAIIYMTDIIMDDNVRRMIDATTSDFVLYSSSMANHNGYNGYSNTVGVLQQIQQQWKQI